MDDEIFDTTLEEFYRMTIYDILLLLEEKGYMKLETNIWNKDNQEFKLIIKIEEVHSER